MATITASLFSALDGVVDPGIGNWHFPYFNEEMGEAVTGTHEGDVMLFGRVTYDSFAGAWPDREAAGEDDAGFAKKLGDMRKIVASRSKQDFTWRNTEQVDGDLIEAVSALKQDPAIDRIVMSGSVSIVRQLLDAGLLDELHLFVHPATAGSGLRLFDDRTQPKLLRQETDLHQLKETFNGVGWRPVAVFNFSVHECQITQLPAGRQPFVQRQALVAVRHILLFAAFRCSRMTKCHLENQIQEFHFALLFACPTCTIPDAVESATIGLWPNCKRYCTLETVIINSLPNHGKSQDYAERFLFVGGRNADALRRHDRIYHASF